MIVTPIPNPARSGVIKPDALRTLAAASVMLLPCGCGKCKGVAAAVRWPWCVWLLGPWGRA